MSLISSPKINGTIPHKPFGVPGQGYWLDEHRTKKLRTYTHEDFDSAATKPMPVYIDRNPFSHKEPKIIFVNQANHYQLYKKVTVSVDGEIFRATDAEIEAALQNEKSAPSTDAATYVKAVREIRRRHPTTKAWQRSKR